MLIFSLFKQQKLMCIKENKKDNMITLQDIKAAMQQITTWDLTCIITPGGSVEFLQPILAYMILMYMIA